MIIKKNLVVGIEYTLRDFKTKKELDTNVNGKELEFITGKGHIINGLEDELIGMKNGDTKEIVVEATNAYGEVDPNAIESVPKEQFSDIELSVGMSLYGTGEDGSTVQVVVKEINEKTIKVDYNHPLAGKKLEFSILIKSVREATTQELETNAIGSDQSSSCCGSNTSNCCS